MDRGGTESEFYVFEIAFPTDSGGKICEHYMCERFDKFLSSLFQMSKGQEGSEATRIEEGGNDEGGKGKRKKKMQNVGISARPVFIPPALLRFPSQPRRSAPGGGFLPVANAGGWRVSARPSISLSLPSRDSSQFFFELFVSNFTSPPCHVASSFFFPVCPSAIRGVDERARSSCFTSLACPPLSALLPSFLHLFLFFSPFLRSFALLIHFTTVVSSPSILRPPFSCLSVVSSLLPRALRSPPPPAPPLFSAPASSFPSFAAYVGSIYSFPRSLFSPDRLRRYFLVAPSLPWLYATLLSSPSPSFLPSSLTPTGREKQPPLSLARSSLYHRPDSILLSFSLAFSFSPSSIHLSIFLFLSLPYPRAPLSLYFSLSLPFPLSLFSCLLLLSPCSASSFSAERLLRFSSVIDVASSPLPGLFPFAATILETTANQLFLRENASGNDRRCSPPSLSPSRSPRYFSSRYHRAFPGWKD